MHTHRTTFALTMILYAVAIVVAMTMAAFAGTDGPRWVCRASGAGQQTTCVRVL